MTAVVLAVLLPVALAIIGVLAIEVWGLRRRLENAQEMREHAEAMADLWRGHALRNVPDLYRNIQAVPDGYVSVAPESGG